MKIFKGMENSSLSFNEYKLNCIALHCMLGCLKSVKNKGSVVC